MHTNFDLIKSFDIDQMAEFLTDLCHERDVIWLEKLCAEGIDASLVELPRDAQIEINRSYLLENVSDSLED